MSSKSGRKDNKQPLKNIIYIIPILILFLIVPFIMRLYARATLYEISLIWDAGETTTEFFSYYKGLFVLLSAGMMVFISFFIIDKQKIQELKIMNKYYILIGIFAILVIASAVMSPFPFLSYSGAPDRYEGLYIWIAYLIILTYGINYKQEEKTNKIIIYSFFGLIFMYTVIGFTQFIDKDIFTSEWIRPYLMTKKYIQYIDQFAIRSFGDHTIYGVAYNPNYVGSIATIFLGFSLAIGVFWKEKSIKILGIIGCFCSLFLLYGSRSRAGIFGMILMLFVFAILFSVRYISKGNKKILWIPLVIVIMIASIFGISNQNFLSEVYRLKVDIVKLITPSSIKYRDEIDLKDIQVAKDSFTVVINNQHITYDRLNDAFYDGAEMLTVEKKVEDEHVSKYRINTPGYENYIFEKRILPNGTRTIMTLIHDKISLFFDISAQEITSVNQRAVPIVVKDAESWGFEGKEKLGSSRGYIWSRTIPLLKNAIFLGYGPDTFLAIFPNNDVYAIYYSSGNPNLIVDKPHNMFLQMGVNSGVISVLIFFGIVGLFSYYIFKKYSRKKNISNQDALALGCYASCVGYLGAAIFNDSVISVAPLFWILLGLGISAVMRGDLSEIEYTKTKEKNN